MKMQKYMKRHPTKGELFRGGAIILPRRGLHPGLYQEADLFEAVPYARGGANILPRRGSNPNPLLRFCA